MICACIEEPFYAGPMQTPAHTRRRQRRDQKRMQRNLVLLANVGEFDWCAYIYSSVKEAVNHIVNAAKASARKLLLWCREWIRALLEL